MTNRDDEPSADAQLLQQGLGNIRSASRHDDDIKGSVGGATGGTIALEQGDVAVAEAPEARPRNVSKRAVPLNRVDMLRNPAENGTSIARTGPDFQHLVTRAYMCRLDHQRHDVGLGNGLAFLDGKRRIFIGELVVTIAHEHLARHLAHGCQDMPVHHSTCDHLCAHHFLALVAEG